MALSRPRFRFSCIVLLGLPLILFYAEAAVVIPWTLPSQIDFHPSWAAAVQASQGLSPYPAAALQDAGRTSMFLVAPMAWRGR